MAEWADTQTVGLPGGKATGQHHTSCDTRSELAHGDPPLVSGTDGSSHLMTEGDGTQVVRRSAED
jgi:hypothetical protein